MTLMRPRDNINSKMAFLTAFKAPFNINSFHRALNYLECNPLETQAAEHLVCSDPTLSKVQRAKSMLQIFLQNKLLRTPWKTMIWTHSSCQILCIQVVGRSKVRKVLMHLNSLPLRMMMYLTFLSTLKKIKIRSVTLSSESE